MAASSGDVYDDVKRVQVNAHEITVHGWPSDGGMYVKRVDNAQLEYLSLREDENPLRFSDPVEEDAFCERLLLLGAEWRQDQVLHETNPWEYDLEVGYPTTGGVWILKAARPLPPKFEKLYSASNMDERCQILQELGAAFYDDSLKSQDLNWHIDEMVNLPKLVREERGDGKPLQPSFRGYT
jgi:hypothetical protein